MLPLTDVFFRGTKRGVIVISRIPNNRMSNDRCRMGQNPGYPSLFARVPIGEASRDFPGSPVLLASQKVGLRPEVGQP